MVELVKKKFGWKFNTPDLGTVFLCTSFKNKIFLGQKIKQNPVKI
jgi:hypothetical protein